MVMRGTIKHLFKGLYGFIRADEPELFFHMGESEILLADADERIARGCWD
jgi:hypothetical protein